MSTKYEFTVQDLFMFAKRYVAMGSSVQEQLVQLMEGQHDGINPNAVKVMREKLFGFHDEIDGVIESFLRKNGDV